ncbi:DUF3107 domain-containing protein [Nigerium massiliense]|uniref:DUF3107 domain-containing protein n=1 Tax=Nigerium massiliense TaxID=1522317 RepID=UPI00058C5A02|nr:DUF3107 domain-containing protein [Nigerium massiliense]
MEVKVGIQHVAREVVVDTDQPAADVEKSLRSALTDGDVFSLTDDKGRTVLIPTAHIAYVDLGQEHARPVGFGAV